MREDEKKHSGFGNGVDRMSVLQAKTKKKYGSSGLGKGAQGDG